LLPVGQYFWRQGQLARWYKIWDQDVVSFDEPTIVKKMDVKNELILSDPLCCSKCWSDLPLPIPKVCPECCAICEHDEIKIKEIITAWTGNLNPYI